MHVPKAKNNMRADIKVESNDSSEIPDTGGYIRNPPATSAFYSINQSINQYFVFTSVHTKKIFDKQTNKHTPQKRKKKKKRVDFIAQPTLK